MEDYSKVLADNILKYRKEGGFTQDALADKMGVSFQTVSKWETGASCPDVVRLPELADIFGLTLDEFFGREAVKETEIEFSPVVQSVLPWPNDDTIRAAVFEGHKLLEDCDSMSKFTFCLQGEAKNVVSYCNIECESIKNGANAGCDVNVSGGINGGVNAGCDVNVRGDINGGANAGCDMSVGGNVSRDALCGGGLTVNGDIEGNAECGGNITCNLIKGDVSCEGDINYN